MRGSAYRQGVRWMNPLLLGLSVGLLLVLAAPVPASACSMEAPPHIEVVAPGEPVRDYSDDVFLGVYEFEFVAHSPGLIVVGPRSATVVTRYWGVPPSDFGPQRVGSDLGVLGGDGNCGQHLGGTGEVGYWYVDSRNVDHPNQSRASLTVAGVDGSLTPEQEAMLEERFGPSVVVGVSVADRSVGFLMAWQWQLVALGVVAGVIAGIVLFRRRRSRVSNAPETAGR